MPSNQLKHIAIIMDGNGRWAKLNNKSRLEGHRKGVDAVRRIIQKSIELKIKSISLYTFSNDNWNRPKVEIEGLINLFYQTLEREIKSFIKNDIKVSFIGDFSKFPKSLRQLIDKTTQDTYNNCALCLNIALGYSGRKEILYATKKIVNKVLSGKLSVDNIDDSVFSTNLYGQNLPDPDILIRTGKECRVSDFMLWQIAYSELFFIDKYWPDFNEQDFLNIINDFRYRERRYGKISEQMK